MAKQLDETLLSNHLWPVTEAKRVLQRINWQTPQKGFVLFETGYGPSGLPHVGTFGEVVRTSFVRQAFQLLAPHIPTRLLVFSDDYDGMRKIPDNVPNKESLVQHIGKPLTAVPDPFGEEKSYGDYMNKRLKNFLDNFGFEYEFLSSTECYKNGTFDKALVISARKYKQLMDIMLPTLSKERQKTYSPFMPIDPETGIVLETGVIDVNPETATIRFIDKNSVEKTTKFTQGGCKLQWKCDFGMRWAVFDVDYEIYGKDHYPNETIYRSICKTIGNTPPVNFFYELFLDEDSKKVSKTKGNGMNIEEWLKYTTPNVLSYYMFQKPKVAKRMYFDIVPKTFDTYLDMMKKYQSIPEINIIERSKNPMFFVNNGKNGPSIPEISFSILLNMAAACNPDNEEILWHFLSKYNKNIKKEKSSLIETMVSAAIKYYNTFIVPTKKYYIPNEKERNMILSLKQDLISFENDHEVVTSENANAIQDIVYEIANRNGIDQKKWFSMLYSTLLGLDSGPRMGTFISIYGIQESIELINLGLSRKANDDQKDT